MFSSDAACEVSSIFNFATKKTICDYDIVGVVLLIAGNVISTNNTLVRNSNISALKFIVLL
jgi:hypothetical protein